MLRVLERAYHIWAENGGDADRNWLRAETEILHTSAAPPQELTRRKSGAETGGRGRNTFASRSVLTKIKWSGERARARAAVRNPKRPP